MKNYLHNEGRSSNLNTQSRQITINLQFTISETI